MQEEKTELVVLKTLLDRMMDQFLKEKRKVTKLEDKVASIIESIADIKVFLNLDDDGNGKEYLQNTIKDDRNDKDYLSNTRSDESRTKEYLQTARITIKPKNSSDTNLDNMSMNFSISNYANNNLKISKVEKMPVIKDEIQEPFFDDFYDSFENNFLNSNEMVQEPMSTMTYEQLATTSQMNTYQNDFVYNNDMDSNEETMLGFIGNENSFKAERSVASPKKNYGFKEVEKEFNSKLSSKDNEPKKNYGFKEVEKEFNNKLKSNNNESQNREKKNYGFKEVEKEFNNKSKSNNEPQDREDEPMEKPVPVTPQKQQPLTQQFPKTEKQESDFLLGIERNEAKNEWNEEETEADEFLNMNEIPNLPESVRLPLPAPLQLPPSRVLNLSPPKNPPPLPWTIPKEKKHMCDLCDNKFVKYYNLKLHLRDVHHKEVIINKRVSNEDRTKKFECELCHHLFPKSYNLKLHIRSVHHDIRLFKCDTCGIRMKSKRNLSKHKEAVHDKIKDNQCNYCTFACYTKEVLRNHIDRAHHRLTTHNCHKCSYGTFGVAKLNNHIRTVHDKIKDQQCHLCPGAFASSYNLKMHVKTVHENTKIFNCEYCEFGTNRKSLMVMHVRDEHPGGSIDESIRGNWHKPNQEMQPPPADENNPLLQPPEMLPLPQEQNNPNMYQQPQSNMNYPLSQEEYNPNMYQQNQTNMNF